MEETAQNINQNEVNIYSRNTPVALICGAGSFIGSHVIGKLLEKRIQVIGSDDFKQRKREYLQDAVKNRNFHLLNIFEKESENKIPRIDYLFIIGQKETEIEKIFVVAKEKKCKILLVSNIELYKREVERKWEWLKELEVKTAKLAKENNLNARVLRLSAVYGPRMDFLGNDPILKLIEAAAKYQLQKEVDLEFITRALYIEDAVELIVKSMFAGATALKIFDGALPSPVKISEIKQVLLDPVWYEQRGFYPTQLPPWMTPNLEKTIKQLNWKPKTGLVYGLKQTLNYFKTHDEALGQPEDIDLPEEKKKLFNKLDEKKQEGPVKSKEEKENRGSPGKIKRLIQKAPFYLVLLIIFYALIWPFINLALGIFSFNLSISAARENLEEGEFDAALKNLTTAKKEAGEAESLLSQLEPVLNLPFLTSYGNTCRDLVNLAKFSGESGEKTVLGMENLFNGLKAVTGEITTEADGYFNKAQIEFKGASEDILKIRALVSREKFKNGMPLIFWQQADAFSEKIFSYEQVIDKGRAAAILLPQITAKEGKRNYLVLLQNNMELRPGGGFIGSYAKLGFEGGKLKKMEVNDIYALDGQLDFHIEPPVQVREDLGQKDWYLRDSNIEPDFPTNAKTAQWFYAKESGEQVDGVIALDISALENLLRVVGPLQLTDYGEKITADNLFEKAVAHAEQDFFPGSQEKKTFLTALTTQLFNKIFFLPKQNWPGIVAALGNSLEEKHFNIFLQDNNLFSYLAAQGWTGAMPKISQEEEGQIIDFLATSEANFGGNKANYYLDRSYILETGFGRDGEVRHKLTISYTNRSPENTWPGGLYKNRFNIYLPMGTKLTQVLWGQDDVTGQVKSFSDFGRGVFSLLLTLEPKQQKDLVINYELGEKLKFVNNLANYRLDVIKQPGTLKDSLQWKVSYPINYQITGEGGKVLQEQVITTDLGKDRSFAISLHKKK